MKVLSKAKSIIVHLILKPLFLVLSRIAVGRINGGGGQSKYIQTLKQHGYPFNPLWKNDIPKLQENSLDISIIIPVYNSEKYLSKCLDSILNQKTQYSYEVICIDDGSTDKSKTILDEYSQKYSGKLVYRTQNNQGTGSARNAGIALAKGEYVGFIDNDDYVSNEYLEVILKSAKENNADLVQTGRYIINTNDTVLSVKKKNDIVLDDSDKKLWYKVTEGYIWAGCYKKSVFSNMRLAEGFWYEDMITRFVLLRLCKKLVILGEPLYYYRVHNTNTSKRIDGGTSDIKTVDQYWLAKLFYEYAVKQLDIKPNDSILLERLFNEWTCWQYLRMKKLNNEDRKAIFYLESEFVKCIVEEYSVDINTILNDMMDILPPMKAYERILKRQAQKEMIKGLVTGNYNKWLLAAKAY